MENNFHRTIFVDIEPAGLDMDDPIMEIAAVVVETGTYREIDTLDMKIEFEMKYLTNFEALGVNKFSAETWAKYALPSEAAAEKLSRFFRKYATVEKKSKKNGTPYTVAKLAGHNADKFDTPRIERLFQKHKKFFPAMRRTLCTMQKAAWFFEDNPGIPQPENYQLGTLIDYFNLDRKPTHSALEDTLATVDLAQVLAECHRITATTAKTEAA